jgi:hypothetical protein
MSNASVARTPAIERRVRLAGVLVCLGLLIQLLTLIRIHPLAFVAFILISCPLVFAGLLLYLYSVVSYAPEGHREV